MSFSKLYFTYVLVAVLQWTLFGLGMQVTGEINWVVLPQAIFWSILSFIAAHHKLKEYSKY